MIQCPKSYDSVLGTCSVLEHLEKTSTEHFDFTEHRARAPSTSFRPSTEHEHRARSSLVICIKALFP